MAMSAAYGRVTLCAMPFDRVRFTIMRKPIIWVDRDGYAERNGAATW